MRVAVIYFGQSQKISSIAKAYAEGVAKQGYDVAVINGLKDTTNLFIYDYLILGTEPMSMFSSKIDVSVQYSLKNLGHINGKASYAFLLQKGLWGSKSLQLWMKWLESCGLLLMLSDVVVQVSEARLLGKRISIYK